MSDIKSALLRNLHNRRRVFAGILLFVILTVILFLRPFASDVEVRVVVSGGMSAKQIASSLKEKRLIRSETLFLVFVVLRRAQDSLQAGEYVFTSKTGIVRTIVISTLEGAFTISISITLGINLSSGAKISAI